MPKDTLYTNYGNDSFRWFELMGHLGTTYKFNPTEDTILDALQAAIIQTQDVPMAYFFASTFSYRPHLMQRVVLSSQHLLYLYLFARHIQNADVKALQTTLLSLPPSDNRLKAICEFARYVVGAQVKKLETIVIREADPYAAHYFAKHIKDAHLSKLKPILLKSGKPRYLYWLAQQTPSTKELRQIEDLMIVAKSFQYIRLLAENIPKVNIQKLEQFVLDSGNIKEIKKFAQSVKTARSKGLAILF